ncbi:MAG: hypothetical protein ABI904_15630 [Chloroflexota bacterium]
MQKTSFLSYSVTFFVALISTYIVVITAEWSLVQAYTYFQGDSLKTIVGNYWITLFYTVPLIIALCAAIIRIVSLRRNAKTVKEIDITHKPDFFIIRKKEKYFSYKGLLWKPGRFRFQNPTPVCPEEDCQRPVDCFRINPPQYLISANVTEMQDFLNKQNTPTFVYRCPLHNNIPTAPNESLMNLTKQAKYEQSRK